MTYLSAVTLLLAIVVQVQAQWYPGFRPRNRPQPARCSGRSKPCRMSMSMENDWGEPTQTSAAHLCSCNQGATCPDDWSLADHVVSRNLISSSYTVTLNLMFCDRVQPDRVCRGGETSVVTSGFLAIPNELEEYKCTCQDGVPLQLSRRYRTLDYKYRHEYICDDQKPTCSLSVLPCMTVVNGVSRYHCKCPGRSQCQVQQEPRRTSSHVSGFCRAPTPANRGRPQQ